MVTLLRGDCVARLQQLPAESIDWFVTDPTYGISVKLHPHPNRSQPILGDGKGEVYDLWKRWLSAADRVANSNGRHEAIRAVRH